MRIEEEKDINVKFPEEYFSKDLAGKDATFKVKLHEIKKKELPELDDEFAKDVSEFDTLEELKNSIKEKIQTERLKGKIRNRGICNKSCLRKHNNRYTISYDRQWNRKYDTRR